MLRVARSNDAGRVLMAGLIWTDDRMWWEWAVHFCAVSASVLIAWSAGFISAVERGEWITKGCFDEGEVYCLGGHKEEKDEECIQLVLASGR